MQLATIAKRGNPTVLFPEGITSVQNLPWDLSVAIGHAFSIISWYETRPKDKIPPRYMWPHDEELEKFFKRVDDSDNSSEDEDEGAMDNEFADRFK